MCKILIAIKKDDTQSEKIEKIIKAQEHSLSDQPHGISALIVDKNDNISVKRELNDYEKLFVWVYSRIKNAKIIAIHSRQATDGEIDKKNLHFFEIKNYLLAHNGIVGGYSKFFTGCGRQGFFPMNEKYAEDVKYAEEIIEENVLRKTEAEQVNDFLKKEEETDDKGMSDSYKFLENIPKPITDSNLREEIEKTKFVGIGVLFGRKEKRMTVFSTRETKCHTDFKNYIILYSYNPTNVLVKYQNVLGFEIISKDNNERLKPLTVNAGIYEIDFSSLSKGREIKIKKK